VIRSGRQLQWDLLLRYDGEMRERDEMDDPPRVRTSKDRMSRSLVGGGSFSWREISGCLNDHVVIMSSYIVS
jgi:hypothetical protein